MAHLYYGSETGPAEIPDRILAHVKVVATTKLRRGESFLLTWRHCDGSAPGRTSIWMQPSIPLRFVFANPDPEQLDPEYLQQLANQANSSGGIVLEWDDHTAEADERELEPVRVAAVARSEAGELVAA
ncbi:hypothetical protein [Microbacterium cremeum]|uniref:DUF7882 family protein n=1 Tax=Microbacterium cremeum TaxID=2782169 RepID=UPI001E5EA3CC|nr:hypothetical protein [Microbacterium cremeum]